MAHGIEYENVCTEDDYTTQAHTHTHICDAPRVLERKDF